MIYFGLRSSQAYLGLLRDVRHAQHPHHLCSVIGGLAFLHAIGPNTRRITLSDIDPDARPHCELILELLNLAVSGREFLSILCGREVQAEWWKPHDFGERLPWLPRLAPRLSQNALELWQRTYAQFRFAPGSNQAEFENATIKFYGSDLTALTFCWQFGKGNFSGDSDFESLRRILQHTPIQYDSGGLDQLDFGALSQKDGLPIQLLASNTESPLFTRNDAVLRQAQRTAQTKIYYSSWTRKMSIYPKHQAQSELIERLRVWVDAQACHAVGRAPELQALSPQSLIRFDQIDQISAARLFNQALLLCDTRALSEPVESFVSNLVPVAVPCFHRLLFISTAPERMLAILTKLELQTSYFVRCIDWAADVSIQVWEMRGAIAQKTASSIPPA